MMDCKRALVETERRHGRRVKADLARRASRRRRRRPGRETTEGKVVFDLSTEDVGAMVAVGCETEPVSNNADFMVFAQRVLYAVEKHGPNAVEELDGERAELIAKLGENVVVRDAVRYEAEATATC